MYRGSVKDHAKVPPRLKKRPPLHVPDGLLEVSREHLLKKVPPCDISPAKRIGIAPLPSPMPRPGYERIGILPLPSPMPRPEVSRRGLDPGPIGCSPWLAELLDMYTDAVRRSDYRAADMIEEVLIIVTDF